MTCSGQSPIFLTPALYMAMAPAVIVITERPGVTSAPAEGDRGTLTPGHQTPARWSLDQESPKHPPDEGPRGPSPGQGR